MGSKHKCVVIEEDDYKQAKACYDRGFKLFKLGKRLHGAGLPGIIMSWFCIGTGLAIDSQAVTLAGGTIGLIILVMELTSFALFWKSHSLARRSEKIIKEKAKVE